MEQTYYKARNTLIEMLKDRGYQYAAESNGLDFFYKSFEEFGELFKGDQMDLTGIQRPDGFPVYVRVVYNQDDIKDKRHLFDKNKPAQSVLAPVANYYNLPLTNAAEWAELYKKVHVIVVYRSTKKGDKYDFTLETQFLEDPNTEAFPVHKLTFNVTKHDLVPKYEVLSEEERKKVLARYNASRQMLIKICLDDPVNLYYNGRPGDIYKIHQDGYRPSYRTVVNRPLPRKK